MFKSTQARKVEAAGGGGQVLAGAQVKQKWGKTRVG